MTDLLNLWGLRRQSKILFCSPLRCHLHQSRTTRYLRRRVSKDPSCSSFHVVASENLSLPRGSPSTLREEEKGKAERGHPSRVPVEVRYSTGTEPVSGEESPNDRPCHPSTPTPTPPPVVERVRTLSRRGPSPVNSNSTADPLSPEVSVGPLSDETKGPPGGVEVGRGKRRDALTVSGIRRCRHTRTSGRVVLSR